MITRTLARWIDDRLGAATWVRSALNKAFPDHWSFMLGEVALYCFVILVGTGVFLTFFFEPTLGETVYQGRYEPLQGVEMSRAYRSTVELSFDVRAGLVMRQMHHWAANIFVGAIVLHMARVFFTGAFRKPRELNWVIGLTLLLLAMFNGFTGYSLPDDVLSGTGLHIAYSVALSIPVVGTWLTFLVFGGEFPADDIISRLYVIHILLVPGAIAALLTAHLAILWRQKHTQFAGPGRTEHNVIGSALWPVYAMKSIGLFVLIAAGIAALGGLVQINPVWLYGPFDPAAVSSPAQPDWYIGWGEGALRLFPSWELTIGGYTIPNPFYPAVLLPGITFTVAYAWPWLEAWVTKDRAPHHLLDRPRDRPVRTSVGAAAFSFYAVIFIAGSNDILALLVGVDVLAVTRFLRVATLVAPPATFLVTLVLCRGLRLSGARGILHLPPSALRQALRRRPGREGSA